MRIAASNLYWGKCARTHTTTGVLVLAGSSGRIDQARVDMLAARGIPAVGLRWFGGSGLPERPQRVPLELFAEALALLGERTERQTIMGLSYGAEAALVTASWVPHPADVVALAPTHVVWQGEQRDSGEALASKWTWQGEDLPFLPLSSSWRPGTGKPEFVGWYEASLRDTSESQVTAATIPVERIRGRVVVVAGGDDRVWPAARSARFIADRRRAYGQETNVVITASAGHQIVLPGEAARQHDRPYAVGGNVRTATELGRVAWPHIASLVAGPAGLHPNEDNS